MWKLQLEDGPDQRGQEGQVDEVRRLRDCILVRHAVSSLTISFLWWHAACSLLMRVHIVCVLFSSEECEKDDWKAHKLTHPSKAKKAKKVKQCGSCGVRKGGMKEGKKVKLTKCGVCETVYW